MLLRSKLVNVTSKAPTAPGVTVIGLKLRFTKGLWTSKEAPNFPEKTCENETLPYMSSQTKSIIPALLASRSTSAVHVAAEFSRIPLIVTVLLPAASLRAALVQSELKFATGAISSPVGRSTLVVPLVTIPPVLEKESVKRFIAPKLTTEELKLAEAVNRVSSTVNVVEISLPAPKLDVNPVTNVAAAPLVVARTLNTNAQL